MKKPLPAKKRQAKAPPAKKQIPVKKQAPDRIDELVKKRLGNIADAENAFKSAVRVSVEGGRHDTAAARSRIVARSGQVGDFSGDTLPNHANDLTGSTKFGTQIPARLCMVYR